MRLRLRLDIRLPFLSTFTPAFTLAALPELLASFKHVFLTTLVEADLLELLLFGPA